MVNVLSSKMNPLLEAVDVRKRYRVQAGWRRFSSIMALEGVSVQAWEGKTLSIAGESGCGKSTLGRLLLGLIPPESGEVRFAGRSLEALPESSWRDYRRSIQMVFQNSLVSFNPMLTVGGTIRDAQRLRHDLHSRTAKNAEAERLMALVGLDPSLLKRYPPEMSVGQLQKASIARALATKPRMVFLDEPTSALDASGRRQMIELLQALQAELGLGYILISHDFHVIRAMAHYVAVMYLGKIVEEGPADEVLGRAGHPYTRALVAASQFETGRKSRWRMRGEVSQLPMGYQGCKLLHRCPDAVDRCRDLQSLVSIGPHHTVRCGRALEIKRQESNPQSSDHEGSTDLHGG